MARIIMSAKSTDNKNVDVTPEAINSFYIRPTSIDWIDGTQNTAARNMEVTLQANVSEAAPVQLTLTDSIGKITVTREMDERAFANSMVEAILTNHGDIDDVVMLQEEISAAVSDIARQIWEKDGSIYSNLRIPGFGFVEVKNDTVAVVDELKFAKVNNTVQITAGGWFDLTSYGNMGKGHLHFLPKGMDRFLVFDLEVNSGRGDTKGLLSNKTMPAPSKEIPVGEVPKSLKEYENVDKYLEAVTTYMQKHMGVGNDRRVELEDDLIF